MGHGASAQAGDNEPLASATSRAFVPHFDVMSADGIFRIVGDLPGVREIDLHIVLSGNVVTVIGKRSAEPDDADGATGRIFARERTAGTFEREFSLPVPIDPKTASARLDSGVLRLDLRAKEESDASDIGLSSKVRIRRFLPDRGW